MKHSRKPEEHHKPSEERSVSGEVKVHGAVEVFNSQDAIKEHEAERGQDKSYKESTQNFEKSYLFVTSITAVISFLYLAVTALLFWENKRSADYARDTLESVQRAFLTFYGIDENRMMVEQNKWTWEVNTNWQNSGTTPAVDVVNYFKFEEVAPDFSKESFSGHPKTSDFTFVDIGPKITMPSQSYRASDTFFFGQELGDLKNFNKPPNFSPKQITYWGYALYKDIFYPRTAIHLTEFCLEYAGSELLLPNRTIRFVKTSCRGKNHNCVDEQCPDYKEMVALYPK